MDVRDTGGGEGVDELLEDCPKESVLSLHVANLPVCLGRAVVDHHPVGAEVLLKRTLKGRVRVQADLHHETKWSQPHCLQSTISILGVAVRKDRRLVEASCDIYTEYHAALAFKVPKIEHVGLHTVSKLGCRDCRGRGSWCLRSLKSGTRSAFQFSNGLNEHRARAPCRIGQPSEFLSGGVPHVDVGPGDRICPWATQISERSAGRPGRARPPG